VQFFVLRDLRTKDREYDAYALRMKPTGTGDAPRCPACNEYVGMLPWLPPYHVEILVHGSRLGDVIECSGEELLVSAHFRDAWMTEGLRGIEVFSPLDRVRIRPARLGRKPVTYFHIAPRLFDAQVDLEHSLIEYSRPMTCPKCKSGGLSSVRGFAIDESTWHGEDMFQAWGLPGLIIASDRVRQLRDKYALTNINLTRVEEYLWDPEKRWTPHCYYLPDGWTPPSA
jgi:hypothetical protein